MVEKQTVQLTFSGGLDTIDDPYNMPIGKFTSLQNTTFIKRASGGLTSLEKRNGFQQLTATIGTISFLTTFNNNLVGAGTLSPTGPLPARSGLMVFSQTSSAWFSSGAIQPVTLGVQSLVRNTYSQTACDAAIANGLICVAYATGELTTPFRYAILDQSTGQNIVTPTAITSSGGSELYPPKVFANGPNFIILYDVLNAAITTSSVFFLQAKTIPAGSPSSVGSTTTISSNASFLSYGSFDGVVNSSTLFLSWNGAGSLGMQAAKLDLAMNRSAIVQISSTSGAIVSVCCDPATPQIYTSFSVASSSSVNFVSTDASLSNVFGTKSVTSSGSYIIANLASVAQGGFLTTFAEMNRAYSYNNALKTNSISTFTVTSGGVTLPDRLIVKSLGLASKAFEINSTSYVLGTYQSTYQSTYFLIDSNGSIAAKLAYGNGGGYLSTGLPSATIIDHDVSIPYLIKDSITSVNKGTAVGSTTQTAGIYSSLGINLATFSFGFDELVSKELGSALNFNGGFHWSYDGLRNTENNFFVFPDDVKLAGAGNSGSMSPQAYYYQIIYSYTDNQGNIYRSAPSIPVTLTAGSGTSAITISAPTLRLTYKTSPNFPTVEIYRWSSAQQIYYRISSPIIQDSSFTASDSFSVTDTAADSSILGNELLYTTGGVLENVNAPSSKALAIFDDRLWLVDAEDPNLLWYSKQVIENTPVEMSDLLTYFVAPNSGTQNPTGPITAIASMDDKLIVFKRNAVFYINGAGPDNTGSNNQYSQPIFVEGSVGCINKNSVVLIPNGLMFQSDNGIWLLGRGLETSYVGKDVEDYNNSNVLSALYVPGTSEVRFSLDSGEVLVYDYLVNEWSINPSQNAISSVVYGNLHTFVNSTGSVFQETVGQYLDGSVAEVVSFTTGWINVAGLQGYARLYRMYMLGQFLSSHRLTMGIAYDYDSTVKQSITIDPTNVVGSGSSVEQWQINFAQQRAQSFQLTLSEVSSGTVGAGLSISGFNIVCGVKKSYPLSVSNRTS